MSKVTTLGEIADIITGPFGSQLHMSDYVDVGIPGLSLWWPRFNPWSGN